MTLQQLRSMIVSNETVIGAEACSVPDIREIVPGQPENLIDAKIARIQLVHKSYAVEQAFRDNGIKDKEFSDLIGPVRIAITQLSSQIFGRPTKPNYNEALKKAWDALDAAQVRAKGDHDKT